ncbi:hypothetical protein FOMPIDRAFT_1060343 [Fomitopsis schrenkii]|uniref:Uncharacterized protein n=1 Tax=Fomitopsis schrenkii TaxID=2126942 RepID=S8FFW9_FOMSC|nr:hypothetical protein FOMPIDRAFT_1060343 [Fomitopsis schrenkii]
MTKQTSFYNLLDDVSKQTVSYWDTCRIAYNKIPNQTEFSEHFVVTLIQAAPACLGDDWVSGHKFNLVDDQWHHFVLEHNSFHLCFRVAFADKHHVDTKDENGCELRREEKKKGYSIIGRQCKTIFLTYAHDAIYFLDTATVKAEIAKQVAANPQGWEAVTDQEKCTFLFNKLARPWSKGLDQILYPAKYEYRK